MVYHQAILGRIAIFPFLIIADYERMEGRSQRPGRATPVRASAWLTVYKSSSLREVTRRAYTNIGQYVLRRVGPPGYRFGHTFDKHWTDTCRSMPTFLATR